MQNDWCPRVKELQVSKTKNKDDDVDDIINSANDNVNVPLSNACKESITLFRRK